MSDAARQKAIDDLFKDPEPTESGFYGSFYDIDGFEKSLKAYMESQREDSRAITQSRKGKSTENPDAVGFGNISQAAKTIGKQWGHFTNEPSKSLYRGKGEDPEGEDPIRWLMGMTGITHQAYGTGAAIVEGFAGLFKLVATGAIAASQIPQAVLAEANRALGGKGLKPHEAKQLKQVIGAIENLSASRGAYSLSKTMFDLIHGSPEQVQKAYQDAIGLLGSPAMQTSRAKRGLRSGGRANLTEADVRNMVTRLNDKYQTDFGDGDLKQRVREGNAMFQGMTEKYASAKVMQKTAEEDPGQFIADIADLFIGGKGAGKAGGITKGLTRRGRAVRGTTRQAKKGDLGPDAQKAATGDTAQYENVLEQDIKYATDNIDKVAMRQQQDIAHGQRQIHTNKTAQYIEGQAEKATSRMEFPDANQIRPHEARSAEDFMGKATGAQEPPQGLGKRLGDTLFPEAAMTPEGISMPTPGPTDIAIPGRVARMHSRAGATGRVGGRTAGRAQRGQQEQEQGVERIEYPLGDRANPNAERELGQDMAEARGGRTRIGNREVVSTGSPRGLGGRGVHEARKPVSGGAPIDDDPTISDRVLEERERLLDETDRLLDDTDGLLDEIDNDEFYDRFADIIEDSIERPLTEAELDRIYDLVDDISAQPRGSDGRLPEGTVKNGILGLIDEFGGRPADTPADRPRAYQTDAFMQDDPTGIRSIDDERLQNELTDPDSPWTDHEINAEIERRAASVSDDTPTDASMIATTLEDFIYDGSPATREALVNEIRTTIVDEIVEARGETPGNMDDLHERLYNDIESVVTEAHEFGRLTEEFLTNWMQQVISRYSTGSLERPRGSTPYNRSTPTESPTSGEAPPPPRELNPQDFPAGADTTPFEGTGIGQPTLGSPGNLSQAQRGRTIHADEIDEHLNSILGTTGLTAEEASDALDAIDTDTDDLIARIDEIIDDPNAGFINLEMLTLGIPKLIELLKKIKDWLVDYAKRYEAEWRKRGKGTRLHAGISGDELKRMFDSLKAALRDQATELLEVPEHQILRKHRLTKPDAERLINAEVSRSLAFDEKFSTLPTNTDKARTQVSTALFDATRRWRNANRMVGLYPEAQPIFPDVTVVPRYDHLRPAELMEIQNQLITLVEHLNTRGEETEGLFEFAASELQDLFTHYNLGDSPVPTILPETKDDFLGGIGTGAWEKTAQEILEEIGDVTETALAKSNEMLPQQRLEKIQRDAEITQSEMPELVPLEKVTKQQLQKLLSPKKDPNERVYPRITDINDPIHGKITVDYEQTRALQKKLIRNVYPGTIADPLTKTVYRDGIYVANDLDFIIDYLKNYPTATPHVIHFIKGKQQEMSVIAPFFNEDIIKPTEVVMSIDLRNAGSREEIIEALEKINPGYKTELTTVQRVRQLVGWHQNMRALRMENLPDDQQFYTNDVDTPLIASLDTIIRTLEDTTLQVDDHVRKLVDTAVADLKSLYAQASEIPFDKLTDDAYKITRNFISDIAKIYKTYKAETPTHVSAFMEGDVSTHYSLIYGIGQATTRSVREFLRKRAETRGGQLKKTAMGMKAGTKEFMDIIKIRMKRLREDQYWYNSQGAMYEQLAEAIRAKLADQEGKTLEEIDDNRVRMETDKVFEKGVGESETESILQLFNQLKMEKVIHPEIIHMRDVLMRMEDGSVSIFGQTHVDVKDFVVRVEKFREDFLDGEWSYDFRKYNETAAEALSQALSNFIRNAREESTTLSEVEEGLEQHRRTTSRRTPLNVVTRTTGQNAGVDTIMLADIVKLWNSIITRFSNVSDSNLFAAQPVQEIHQAIIDVLREATRGTGKAGIDDELAGVLAKWLDDFEKWESEFASIFHGNLKKNLAETPPKDLFKFLMSENAETLENIIKAIETDVDVEGILGTAQLEVDGQKAKPHKRPKGSKLSGKERVALFRLFIIDQIFNEIAERARTKPSSDDPHNVPFSVVQYPMKLQEFLKTFNTPPSGSHSGRLKALLGDEIFNNLTNMQMSRAWWHRMEIMRKSPTGDNWYKAMFTILGKSAPWLRNYIQKKLSWMRSNEPGMEYRRTKPDPGDIPKPPPFPWGQVLLDIFLAHPIGRNVGRRHEEAKEAVKEVQPSEISEFIRGIPKPESTGLEHLRR